MKFLTAIGTATIVLTALAVGQPNVVHFKKIQEYLPSKALPGFERKKPTGSTQTAMGMKMSEASVRYVKPAPSDSEQEQSITIKIEDMSAFPSAAWAAAYEQADFETETETGYDKSITLEKKYKGIERASTGDSKSCSLTFAVGSRFNVSMEAAGFADAALLHALAESMDLARLEKLQPE